MRGLSFLATRFLACTLTAALCSCLPVDTRPPPGTLHVTVTSDEALRSGFDTGDGWHIRYQRFFMVLGQVQVSGDACNNYSAGGGTGYTRIYNMQTAGPQKVTVVYGLGACEFGFRVGNPASDSLLGVGVTEADKTFMRTPGTDTYSTNRGVSVQIEGTAAKGGITKRFAWSFRQSSSYAQCEAGDGGAAGVTLRGQQAQTMDILIPGAALFDDALNPAHAMARFEPFALADDHGNRDGEITLAELAAIPQSVADIQVADAGVDSGVWTSLEDDLYLGLVPRIARFDDTGSCTLRLRQRR